MLIVVNCLQLQWRIAGGNYIRRLQLDHNYDNNGVRCPVSQFIYQLETRARMASYSSKHMQLAYSKSADELGEAVAEQAAAATTDLPLPAYHLLLLCLCHACT